MGLDMYLSRKTYVKHWDYKEEDNYVITVTRQGEPVTNISTSKISFLEEEVGYWRKANHIHKWFVDHVQEGKDDCRETYVSLPQLKELYDTCLKAIEIKLQPVGVHPEKVLVKTDTGLLQQEEQVLNYNKEILEDILPTSQGFFFGGTQYDEYYMDDVQDTIDILKPIVENTNPQADYYYRASW